jgi:hypothetical protein
MRIRTTLSTAAALALAAGALFAPAGAFARGGGGGFARIGHGPVFGFHQPRLAPHRPSQPTFGHFATRFPWHHGWWNRQRHRGDDQNGLGEAGYGGYGGYGSSYPGGAYDPGDLTGTVGAPRFARPPEPAPEHIGCLSRGYDVPGESGGVVKVTVTRC